MNALSGPTKVHLESFEGKDIKSICTTGYVAANVNHCAHFVSHVLSVKLGLLCGSMKWDTRGQGTSLRVDEIYNACTQRGDWDERPGGLTFCLVFATLSGNFKGDRMGDNPRKHVGIFLTDTVWHYSNGTDRVVSDSPPAFANKFRGAYGVSTRLYYGVPPA